MRARQALDRAVLRTPSEETAEGVTPDVPETVAHRPEALAQIP